MSRECSGNARTMLMLALLLGLAPAGWTRSTRHTGNPAAKPAGSHPGEPWRAVEQQNVIWDAPGRGPWDSMPLGNGDVALNVWVEANGDVCFYIAKTDAWDERGNLLKLGRIRLRFDPPLIGKNTRFEQKLDLGTATVQVRGISPASRLELTLWVDAEHPVVHIESRSDRPRSMTAALELWRDTDTVLPGSMERLTWYHRNPTSNFVSRLRAQNLAGLEKTYPDPLLHRTFGCLMRGQGLQRSNPKARNLRSVRPTTTTDLRIHVLTAQTPTSEAWLERIQADAQTDDRRAPGSCRREHEAWWRRFWSRAWIQVDCPRIARPDGAAITPTGLPLRFGADDKGYNTFRGLLARARVFTRALDGREIGILAARMDAEPPSREGLIGDWRFDRFADGIAPDTSGANRHAKAVGNIDAENLAGHRGVRLRGDAWLEVPNDEVLDRPTSLTLEAWIAPDKLPPGGARIIDKTPAGTAEGYLLDTYPDNSLRLILKAGTLGFPAKLAVGAWSHVAATFDADSNEQCLYLNGVCIARQNLTATESGTEGEVVSRGYALQRFINACAGRGSYPIKFNGSLFCVDWPEAESRGKPDYRRWGPDYWWQNTRLAYWPMPATGDFDMMQPLFRMYTACMPLQKERTKRYFGHEGAYYPETMSFWGLSRDEDYGIGKAREGKPISWHRNRYIRREWQGGIECTAMMLDYYDYTDDRAFAATTLVPFAREIMLFYDRHYQRGPDGKLRIEPAQALETWWDCTDPMPEIAGLTSVLPRLLALPAPLVSPEVRTRWQRLLAQVPELPTRKAGPQTLLAPARVFATNGNCENPELYAVFPYRLCTLNTPGLELARATFAARIHKMCRGWPQDDTQMALLGLTEQARQAIVQRASHHYGKTRFPAFWGPNFDWIPDQDHGGNLLLALQTMLMQCHGRDIHLFPAWPKNWDVDFKLHAPHQTTVRGVYRGGKLIELTVTPASRRADVHTPFPLEKPAPGVAPAP